MNMVEIKYFDDKGLYIAGFNLSLILSINALIDLELSFNLKDFPFYETGRNALIMGIFFLIVGLIFLFLYYKTINQFIVLVIKENWWLIFTFVLWMAFILWPFYEDLFNNLSRIIFTLIIILNILMSIILHRKLARINSQIRN